LIALLIDFLFLPPLLMAIDGKKNDDKIESKDDSDDSLLETQNVPAAAQSN